MTRFRPCIDLHEGKVKQIVGGTLTDAGPGPRENFVSDRAAAWFAERYRLDGLSGGHVIKLGPGNDVAAREALAAYPGGLQIGGGITAENAASWLDAGASHVIVTSWLFDSAGKLQPERLRNLVQCVGRQRIVLDLSCRRVRGEAAPIRWRVAMDRWQTLTDVEVTPETLDALAESCDEFLIHAADVEGLCQGIDEPLVELMGNWGRIPMTYAGGVANFADLERIRQLSRDRVDVTVGSALDLFGGTGVRYDELLGWGSR
jgi:phosphoribosylformimino-5-aminoimidazole carboxamide ribotide isomerase